MRFASVSLDQAEGAILGHNVINAGGRRVLRKGRPLGGAEIEMLRSLGRTSVYAAVLEPGDVDENLAAERITQAVVGGSIRLSGPATGRVNVFARGQGLVRVDVEGLRWLNSLEGVTLATMFNGSPAPDGKMIATTKILPYAVPEKTVTAVEEEAAGKGPLLWLEEIPARRVGLIVSASPASRDRAVAGFESALRRRVEGLGSSLERIDFVELRGDSERGTQELASSIRSHLEGGIELVLLAGETAIQDRHDLAPSAVEEAGGAVDGFGAPVDPGNLLMLAHVGEVPVIGAPGCARSSKPNIVDLILPRLLAGERLGAADLVELGHGGLLEDVPERPLPRSQI